jgi:glutamate synthase domain-containing protein 1/glutamate synthase domain-containing protein 3
MNKQQNPKHATFNMQQINQLLASRKLLQPSIDPALLSRDEAAEGGCGVIGMASTEKLPARHMLQSLAQMRNRGNGKGGGIAAVGLEAAEFGVSQQVLRDDYLLVIAYMDGEARAEVEAEFVVPVFDIDHIHEQAHIADYRTLEGLDVRPPDVVCYFVRVKLEQLKAFKDEFDLHNLPERAAEDEFVYQNSFKLNTSYYASLGEKRAFVLSHGKNLLVLKMVGYGDDVIRYYELEDLHAHVWIGHHRYPTKGRVWHPGGAHPFIGLNEALVHNGDFANHASISEYLAQRNIYPLYLTDTEVAVQVFDLLYRTYRYPLEYVIEALAPTTERDFTLLPDDKQRIYSMLQRTHMHASPDGPWFFLIAQSDLGKQGENIYRLTGITDTSMLRPQVFAWQESGQGGEKVAIGIAASEKQAIDAAMDSLAAEDDRFWGRADRYWNARGGSHTDGGAFLFSVHDDGNNQPELVLTDKFGRPVPVPTAAAAYRQNGATPAPSTLPDLDAHRLFDWALAQLPNWSYSDALTFLSGVEALAVNDEGRTRALDTLTLLMDRRYATGKLRRSSLLSLVDASFSRVVAAIAQAPSEGYAFHAFGRPLPSPQQPEQVVVVDARAFPPQGEDSLGREIHRLVAAGFRRLLLAHAKGQRFVGSGLGPETGQLVIDVYGSSGDYLASGLDGAEIRVHNNGQDQLAQIMKAGRLVVHGDVGQTFMYGAKGGDAFILGNAAGRPLINAVGKPRVVINGTCLDYLAESFMAGDPLNGGGFVVLNGMQFDEDGRLAELDSPYPGGNLFSLASGGAIYVRDPHGRVSEDQLNGGEFVPLADADWALIEPYLQENARLFGIPVDNLLQVDGKAQPPSAVYRKIRPGAVRALQAEEAWVTKEKARVVARNGGH